MTDQTANPAIGAADRGLAVGAVAPRSGRRITAESFRLLTARLRSADVALEPVASVPASVVLTQPDMVAPPAVAKAEVRAAPVVVEAVVPTSDPHLQPAADSAELPPLPDFGLPEFTPLDPLESLAQPELPEAAAGDWPTRTEASPLAAPEPATPFAYDPPPAVELQPFRPDTFWEPLAPENPEPEPELELELELEAQHETAATWQDASLAPLAPAVGPSEELVAETVAPEPVVEDIPLPAEIAPSIAGDEAGWPAAIAAGSPEAEQPAENLPDLPSAGDLPVFDLPPFEPAAVAYPVAAEPAEVAAVDIAAAPVEVAAPVADAVVPTPQPEAAAVEPAKDAAAGESPLVGRVVDAMLKTVSDAVYAKPTAAERAAFLRDIATLLEAEAGAETAQAPDEPLPKPMIAAAPQPQPAAAEPLPAADEPVPVAAVAAPDLTESLAGRLGASASLLRKPAEAPDPFSRTAPQPIRLDPKPRETVDADENSGEMALSLLDMMSAGSASGLPQERALAADTLLRMIPRVPVKQLIAVVERMAIMESPPALLVAKLIRDPRGEVIAPLLERCMHITDQDLINASLEGDNGKRRMIARRRVISPALSDHLIEHADTSVLLTLIRNPGAGISHEAYFRLAEQASRNPQLLAPLCTRADLPAPVAFELFWFVPPELRRFIFSRFLTDSETLNRILKITLATKEGEEHRFPSKEQIDEALGLAVAGKLDRAADQLAGIAGVSPDTALRAFADKDGEPLTVILKALGYPRGKFEELMGRLKTSDDQLLGADRNIAELQSIFDMLSFNKARILLTYWDWYILKSGPYAPHN